MKFVKILFSLFLIFLSVTVARAQNKKLNIRTKQTMIDATRYMVEHVSTHGGYSNNYLPDFSRQWGELESYETQIWVMDPGTVSMGNIFLDAYHTTDDAYYIKELVLNIKYRYGNKAENL
jgi:hypothetical protein